MPFHSHILVSLSFLALISGAMNGFAQAWPDNVEPGLNFYRLNAYTMHWARAHRLHILRTIGQCPWRSNRVDTSTLAFEYSGDTAIVTRDGDELDYITINKFDTNDSLRFESLSNPTTGYRSASRFDSCGRVVWRLEEGKIHTWTYTVRDNYVMMETEKSDHRQLTYYGANNREDSVLLMWKVARGRKRNRSTTWSIFERRLSVFDTNNLPTVSFIYHEGTTPDHVDSMFYHANRVLARTAEYERHCSSDKPQCLCGENRYDERGNIVFRTFSQGKFADCGEDMDTNVSSYQYDEHGRPIQWNDENGHCTYSWGEDSQPLEAKSFDRTGKLLCEQHFVYDFLKQ